MGKLLKYDTRTDLCSIGNTSSKRSIFPFDMFRGYGFLCRILCLPQDFLNGKAQPSRRRNFILDCQVGVPLHLVLKEGEAFVAPIFGEMKLSGFFETGRWAREKNAHRNGWGYCPTFEVVIQPQAFCLRLDFTPIMQGSVIPV